MVKIDSEELKELVSSTITSIEEGMKDKSQKYLIDGSIEFEVAVVTLKKGEGGIKIYVVNAGAEYSKEDITKIKFKIKEKPKVPRARTSR